MLEWLKILQNGPNSSPNAKVKALVRWWDNKTRHDPYAGVRIEEAGNPGPFNTNNDESETLKQAWSDQELHKNDNAMWIVTQNIGSLYALAERHTATRADVYAWQEAEIPMHERQVTAEKMRKLGYNIRCGWEDNHFGEEGCSDCQEKR